MRILVINGSPKGQNSITLQTSRYLELLHPEHEFTYIDAAAKLRAYEKDFSEAAALIAQSELIIFSYPVYTFLAPSQLHRFISLMKADGCARGKAATQITTSKHFYDITAHAYIRDNCFDMGINYMSGLSADMEDLTLEKGQKEAHAFFDYTIWRYENALFEECKAAYTAPKHIPASVPADTAKKGGNAVIVADLADDDVQLGAMIARFRAVTDMETKLVNIHSFPFKGGCISCFNCASDGVCIYKDGFSELLRNEIQKADAIIISFSIKDHSMGSVFKTYDDRQFCNGHRTVTMGTPFGYIVSGNLSEEENLRTVIAARAEAGGNFLAGIAADETDTDADIDALAKKLRYAVDNKYTQPVNFYGVGGLKIFRDLIWLMQGLMKADHRFFKAHGQYDFPQKQRGKMLAMYGVGFLMTNKKLKAKAGGRISEGMLAPYTKVLDTVKAQNRH